MRLKLLKIVLLLIVLQPFAEIASARYIKLSQLSTEDGLTQNSIQGLMQDDQGYLWIATSEGLNRYDGYRISSPKSPKNILQSNSIQFVWQDSTGLIWIGASPENNFQLDRGNEKLTPITFKSANGDKLEYPVMSNIVETHQNNLWIATYSEIFYFERKTTKMSFVLSLDELFDNSKKEHIIRDLLMVDDLLLIATSNGLYQYNTLTKQSRLLKHTETAIQEEDENNVKQLSLNSQGQILVGTVEGLYSIEQKALQTPSDAYLGRVLIAQLNIWKIIEEGAFYWLATDKGLYQLSKQGELNFILKFSDFPFNISDDDIVNMIEDREGSLWFGSRQDGIFKWHPNPAIKQHWWESSAKDRQLNNDMVYDISQTASDRVWIATNNGLTKLNPQTGKTSNYLTNNDEKEVVGASTIYSVQQHLGKLWLNTFDGIKVYDEITMQKQAIIFPKTDNEIFTKGAMQLFFLSPDLLAITTREGIYQYSISKNSIHLIEPTATNQDLDKLALYFYSTATGDGQSYFVSGVNKTWIFSRENNKLTEFHRVKKSADNDTYTGDLFREGNVLWVTYPGYGIYKLDANSGKELKFISEESIGANSVSDIFPDKKGNIWFSSNDGLLRMNKSNYHVTRLGSHDGLITTEFNAGTKQILPSGEVLLGSVKGVFLFDPNSVTDSMKSTMIPRITNISLLSSNIQSRYSDFNNRTIDLNYDDFGLKVEVSAVLLDKPKQVQYFYWMEGATNIDKTAVKQSELFFPVFNTGINKLYISAVDYNSGLESEPVSLTINSHPAPWLTTSAFIIYILSLFLILAILYRRHNISQLAKEKTYRRIQKSEERLKLALQGSNSGLWDWHANSDAVFEPRVEGSSDKDKIISFKKRLSEVHYRDQNNITAKWRKFLNGDNRVFDVTYRMKDENSQWQWYRDVAMVSEFDINKAPSRVTGTYTNITEKQEATAKTRLYSKAFENTLDTIIILDNNKRIVAANHSLEVMSGYMISDLVQNSITDLIVSSKKYDISEKIFSEINSKRHWKGEAFLRNRNKRMMSVLINATIFSENESEQYYVLSISDISRQKNAENELKKLANYDSLTGLPNRALVLDRITHAINACDRFNKQLAIFFVDLDRFKQINDTLGHEIGDLLLTKVAGVLSNAIRNSDTVGRIGGDEFVVMLEDITNTSYVSRIADNLLRDLKDPMTILNNNITISASIGISIYPQDASNADELLKHADIAMYHVKNGGRNNFQYYEEFMNLAAQHRLAIENNVRSAEKNGEFYLVYQPQFDIEKGTLYGVEALARWKNSSAEMIPPNKFIPVAEDLGLIIPMTERLLEDALESLKSWLKISPNLKLAFNLSACHIYDETFIPFVDRIIGKYPQATKHLKFELTESVLMEDMDEARNIFSELSSRGIDVALDDFGTGYSSLKYLSRLNISQLKIDMSFVKKIDTGPENNAIIKTIISLAKSLHLETVAEGIEEKSQFNFLKAQGVDFAQGYLFSKPLEKEAVEKLLDKIVTIK